MSILKGKAVVITGSGRGIGAACAKGAARQGALVVINDVNASEAEARAAEITAEGGTAIASPGDVTDWRQAGEIIRSCIDRFGRIDGLVNNAALLHHGRIDEFDEAAAQALVRVNVLGPMYCTAHAIKPMLAQGSGSIVNVVSGAHMGMPSLGVYGATKGAVASMVYTWALELANTGVRVNALSPMGATQLLTNSHHFIMGDGSPLSKQDQDLEAKGLPHLPPPGANSPVIEFLLSDQAAHVNGQLVRMDRGALQLYTHPALLMPPVVRSEWTAELVAKAFSEEFKDKQVPCGVLETTHIPVEHHTRKRTDLSDLDRQRLGV